MTTWRKSTYSGPSNSCVGVAAVDSRVAVIDLKAPASLPLILSAGQWRTLLERVKAGRHDR